MCGGTGGKGGDIDGVKFTASQFANIIHAGDGGSTDSAGTPGQGGSVKHVTIVGDIGNFAGEFRTDVTHSQTGMGGLVAGAGGAQNGVLDVIRNGSIDQVTATRIATIIAGTVSSGAVVAGNAVLSITHIKTSVIGADVNGNGVWDYAENTSNSTYDFYDPNAPNHDVLIDGIVLVKTGGFDNPPVPPLKLIEVP